MTLKEFTEKLEEYSPFKYAGHDEEFVFKKNELFIDDNLKGPYTIGQGPNGLTIQTSGLFPFQQNVKIDFGDNQEQIIVNYNEQNLRQYPRNERHPSAVDGLLIFKSLKVN